MAWLLWISIHRATVKTQDFEIQRFMMDLYINIYVYYHIIYIWYVHVIWYIITFIWYICHISHIFVAFLWKIIGNKSIPFFVELVFRRLGLACWQLRFDPPCEISSQKSTLPLGERFDCWYPTGPTEGTPKKPEYSNSSSLTYLGVCCW